jgi:DNA-binding MarR family transcriptional regulator
MGTTAGDAAQKDRFFAWYGMLKANARVLDEIERELDTESGLPLSWFEVLVNLSHCGTGDACRMRMNELADLLVVSRGGVTRIVARLEEAGLVKRVIPKEDRRATFAVLTPAGQTKLDAAGPLVERSVQRHFGRHLSGRDVAGLRRAIVKILEGEGFQAQPASMDAEAAA